MFGKTSIVQFLTLALASSSIAAPAPSPASEDSSLAKRGVETIYLSNCFKTNSADNLSGIFYYPDSDYSQNGEKPASGNYANPTGKIVVWEGNDISGKFGTGVTFTSSILPGSHETWSYSGPGTNGYRTFQCYRDNNRVLFSGSTNWGECHSIYYCV